jgi:hypothetical protein
MDFSSILSYLQNLLGTKQSQNASQYASNLDLQNRSLAQSGQEYNSNLALQTQSEQDANAQAQAQQAFNTTGQTQQNVLQTQAQKDAASQVAAQQVYQNTGQSQQNTLQTNQQVADIANQKAQTALQQAAQQFSQNNTVTPGSATWYAMQDVLNNIGQNKSTSGSTGKVGNGGLVIGQTKLGDGTIYNGGSIYKNASGQTTSKNPNAY